MYDTTATTCEVVWEPPASVTRPVVEYRVDIARVLGSNAAPVWNPYAITADKGARIRFLKPATLYLVRVLARNALSGFGTLRRHAPCIRNVPCHKDTSLAALGYRATKAHYSPRWLPCNKDTSRVCCMA